MTDEPEPEDNAAPNESDDPFPGLRPGRMTSRGKVQPHEKATLFRIAHVGLHLLGLSHVVVILGWVGW